MAELKYYHRYSNFNETALARAAHRVTTLEARLIAYPQDHVMIERMLVKARTSLQTKQELHDEYHRRLHAEQAERADIG